VAVASAGLYASLHLISDNYANIPPLSFLQAGCPSCRPCLPSYVWRKPDEIWLPECLGKIGGCPRIPATFWGCTIHEEVRTPVSIEGSINSEKYTHILDEHLWSVITKYFSERPFIFQDDNALPHCSKFTREWRKKFME